MSKIFQDDWEAAGPEVLAVARAKLVAYIENTKEAGIHKLSRSFG
jgi:hypothetical protein